MADAKKIAGVAAPGPRLTPLGAAAVALAIALPVGGVIWVVELVLF